MNNSQLPNPQTAPCINIPEQDITSIEHPCIIKNRAKAIETLGGAGQITQSLEQGTDQSLSLNFRPDDPASRTILSLHNETSNILLKVTVPKRTGRKRKRGTTGDYVDDVSGPPKKGAEFLIQTLQQDKDQCTIEAVGNITSCHVWRSIPDFAYFTKTSKFMHDFEKHILPQQYPRLKQYSLPRTYGLENPEIMPPAVFSAQTLSHNYSYRQNPAVKTYADPITGSRLLHNRSAPVKLHIQIMMYDDLNYPTSPSSDCPPLEMQNKQVKHLVELLAKLFEERPIWTRRALINSLPSTAHYQLTRHAAAYVCYSLRSGPWRDAYVKFGIDPRSDPKYRIYQTILLKLQSKQKIEARGMDKRLWSRSTDTESHIFTGTKAVPADGKTWQACDLHDPQLKALVEVPDLYLRATCETRYFGWYGNGTSAKLRVLLKAKIDALDTNEELDKEMVEEFLKLPENWDPVSRPLNSTEHMPGYLVDVNNRKTLEWASAYRNICRTTMGDVPKYGAMGKGRLSKPKPKMRPSFLGNEIGGDRVDDEMEQEVDDDAAAAVEYEEPEEGDEEIDDVGVDVNIEVEIEE